VFAGFLAATTAFAQTSGSTPHCPPTTSALYARLRSVGLDPQTVYSVRDASIDRPSLHIDLDDGTVAFTEDICGRITGAFFEGEGEIRLRPRTQSSADRWRCSPAWRFSRNSSRRRISRFNDDTAEALMPFLRPALETAEFTKKWGEASRNLAESDAPRLLLDFSHFLPFFPRLLGMSRIENSLRCCTLICWARPWAPLKFSGMR